MTEEPEHYGGAFVVVEPVATGYRVRVELPPGCDLSRTCESKDEAWSWAACVWSAFRLPLRDMTDANTARQPVPGFRK